VDIVLVSLVLGILALGFDRQIANLMNQMSRAIGEMFPQFRWRGSVPPRSPQRFENWLWFVRFWGAVMCLQGIATGLACFVS
jgi:hypothetical protein